MPHETAAISARSVYTIQPCTMSLHIRKVYACLAVTCHLRFWQNDRDLLRATAGWNGYRNKSQHRKLSLEKKIFPPLLQGFEPATFRSRVRRSNHWAIAAHVQQSLWSRCRTQSTAHVTQAHTPTATLRAKLQALVYDILPSTTAVFSYALGSRKLSANEQFFRWCSSTSEFVTNNSNYIRRLFYNWPCSLRQLK